jgi:2-dehydro-3-deoxyphosphogluconate aldolase/(4S)-4-hydroxy-2-oxoglutarate aldolase
MKPLLEKLELFGLVPVVVLDDAADGVPVAQALSDAGLPCMEITFRTGAAARAIESIARTFPQITLGAGTVLTVEQVDMALSAGATFVVSPGLNRKIVEYCLKKSVVVLPGVATPSDVEVALEYGLDVVKFFPAEASGGIEYLKAMSAPYRTMKFVPTGGIQQTNMLAYLKFARVLACGGSWMVNPELIAAKRFDEVRRLTEEALRIMLGFELKHVGVNGADEQEAVAASNQMAALFQAPVKSGSSSIFVGTSFEFTKKKFPGIHGHLAVGTHSIRRAVAYLERRGYSFRPETKSEKNGTLISIYLRDEIGGFAVHLLQT